MIEVVNVNTSYKRQYKPNSANPVNLSTYLKIATGFFKFIMSKVLAGYQVQLSSAYTMGVLGIRGKKIKTFTDEKGILRGIAVDWPKTNKLWEERPELRRKEFIYHTNDHSNGYKYNFVWWQGGMSIGNKYLYIFSTCRSAKDNFVELIKSGKEYITY